MFFAPYIEGFTLGGALIVAIGAQNAFVIRQGLKKAHLFITAFTCFLGDAILGIVGVTGIGLIFLKWPLLEHILIWAGAAFLFAYGARSLWSACRPHALIAAGDNFQQETRTKTILTLLAFTFLNPHAYVDLFLLLGTVGAEHPKNEWLPFIMGSMSASFLWFFGLTYGASTLSPLFQKTIAWRILDTLTGLLMFAIGIHLIL